MKIPAAKAAVDKEREKLEKISAWNVTKIKSEKQVIDEVRMSGATVHFCIIDGHMSFEKCWVGGKTPKIQRSSCTPRWYCKRRFWILRSIHWTRIFSISNDSSKSHGYHLQTAKLCRTSSGRNICLYPSENGRCSQINENSKIGVSRHLDSSTTTQIAKNMVQYGRPSCSSRTKSVWSSFGMTVIGKAIWENPIKARLGENFQLGMLVRTSWKGLFLSVFVDDIKLAGKKQNLDPTWKLLNKEVDLGEPTSFLDHVYLGCTQRQCEISKEIVDNYRTMFESRISAGELKNYHTRKIFVFLRGPAMWMVMPRNVWNDTVSWQTRRLNISTKYLLHASMTITSKRKKWNLLENCHMYALKLFCNAYTWHELDDVIFYGQWISSHDP